MITWIKWAVGAVREYFASKRRIRDAERKYREALSAYMIASAGQNYTLRIMRSNELNVARHELRRALGQLD